MTARQRKGIRAQTLRRPRSLGRFGEVSADRAYADWCQRHPTRAALQNQHRVATTKIAWALAHDKAGDGIKQATV